MTGRSNRLLDRDGRAGRVDAARMPLFTTLGMIGYVGALFNSVWIIVSIWRSSRG
jgi:hypothetical protein